MKNYFDRYLILNIIFIFLITNIHADENNINLLRHELREKSIAEILESNKYGEIVDIIYPSLMQNYYIFKFKKNNFIYLIAANTEDRDLKCDNDTNCYKRFLCTGCMGIDRINGLKIEHIYPVISPGKSVGEIGRLLSSIDPLIYITIADIDKLLNCSFEITDSGSFNYPYSSYLAEVGEYYVEIAGAGGENKKESYYIGLYYVTKK